MSDTGTDAPTPQEGKAEGQTFDADYVAKLRTESAKYRTEAKANSEAAAKLAVIEEANKTESQKLADRAAAAEAERDSARVEVLRFKVAAKFGIDADDADLFLNGTDEETLTKQAQRLSAREADKKKNGNFVPREGTTSTAPESDERSVARALFGGN